MEQTLTNRQKQNLRRWLWKKLNFQPHPKQLLVLDSEAPIKLFVAGTKAGKTYCGIYYILERLLLSTEKIASIAVIAPIKDQCKLSFDQVYLKCRELKVEIPIDHARSQGYFRVKNFMGGLSDLRIYSTDDPKNLFGAKWQAVLCDEGAQMPDNIWRDYMASNTRDILVATTPESTGTWVESFYLKGLEKNQNRYFSINLDTFSNTKLPGYDPDPQKSSGEYREQWEKAKEIEHAFPETYNRRYLGKFSISDRSYFRHLDACIDDNLIWKNPSQKKIFEIKDPAPNQFYSKGCDLARLHDRTVIWVFDLSRTLVYLEILENTEWDIQEQRIKWVNDRYPGVCQIDATGVGDSVRRNLQKLGILIDPIVFNRRGNTHSTMKDELLAELTIRMANTDMRIPRIPEVVDDFRSVRISQTKAGREIIGDGSGHLPDTVSAAALAMYGLKNMPTRYEIEDSGGEWQPLHRADEFDETTGMPIHSEDLMEVEADGR